MLDDLSEDPVVTLRIGTPAGILLVVAIPVERGNSLVAQGLHINGAGTNLGPGTLGIPTSR
jgi:hypothetical protein